jgi:hypothetical protein
VGSHLPSRYLTRSDSLTAGTFAVASGFLGERFDDHFFRVVACIFTLIVVILWLWVSIKCVEHTIDGKLFFEQGVRFGKGEQRKVDGVIEKGREWSDSVGQNGNSPSATEVAASQIRPAEV